MGVRGILGAGAAVAALASVLASPGAHAQQTPDNSAFLNETIDNKGLPHQAPSIGLPAIYGLNPCATGAAAGITTPLFGISGAISNIDRECETRNNAAVAVTAIKDEAVAREIMCNVKDFREAALRVGKPCRVDQPRPVAAAAPPGALAAAPAAAVAAAAAAPATAQPTLAAAPAAATPSAILSDAPAFCRRPDLDLRLYPDCTSHAASTSTQADAADQRADASRMRRREMSSHRLRPSALVSTLPAE